MRDEAAEDTEVVWVAQAGTSGGGTGASAGAAGAGAAGAAAAAGSDDDRLSESERSETAEESEDAGESAPADSDDADDPDDAAEDDEDEDDEDEDEDEDAEAAAAAAQAHTDEEIAEIEAERERRLDPDNRPENAIVDNSDAELPTVEEYDRIEAEEKEEGQSGSTDPSQAFRDLEYSEEEKEEIAAERERRLDPDNRPDNVEVDNTGRTFEDGKFVD